MPANEQRLVDLGLTSYEARAYLALVRRDSSSPSDVARLSRIPRQRIYDVLKTLVQKGLATHRPGPPTKYAAVAPEFAIERLTLARREELDRIERSSRELIDLLSPAFVEGQKERDPLDYIEVLRDRAAINERFGELQDGIQKEILVFTKPPYAVQPAENIGGLELLERHIEARSVYERSIYEDAEQAEAVRSFVAAGENARVVDRLPLKLVLIDERVALFTLEDPVARSDGLTIMIVEHPALAGLLKLAFEAVWALGQPFV
jgi:sugar-specific transcriptional regulator TrmB